MKRLIWIGLALLILALIPLLGCVSKSKYEALEAEYQYQYSVFVRDNAKLKAQLTNIQSDYQAQIDMLNVEREGLYTDIVGLYEQIGELEKKLSPSPDHAMKEGEIWDNPEFMSIAWEGRIVEFQIKVEEIGRLYYRTHTYIVGETDCNDMAVDLWNMLLTEEIKSVIVIGNLDKEFAEFNESDHAWLIVFSPDGKYSVLEPTTGEVFYKPIPKKYTGFSFTYEKPSDLWADIKKWW